MSGHAYTAKALPARPVPARSGQPRPITALAVAALCLVGMALTWVLAELLPGGQARDSLALHDFELLSRPHVDFLANGLLHLLDPPLFIAWGLGLVAVALLRRRPRVALAVVVVLSMAPLTAEVLKPLLAHPHLQILDTTYISAASWPSGHATAALALVLCAVLVAPADLRPLIIGLGAAFAAAVGCSLLILAWHMPSDVFGGYLVASLWMALAVAGLRAADRRWAPARSRERSAGVRSAAGAVGARVPQ